MALEGSADRRCAFCDSEIATGTPPEHVIPQWISRLRPKGTHFFHTSDPYWQQPAHATNIVDLTADTVCSDCNHHWMSDLETHVSPILKPMIAGTACGLDVPTQALLARWAIKTAMTWDQAFRPEDRVFAPELCRWAKDHDVPPPGSAVLLGRYEGDADWISLEHNNMYRLMPADPSAPGQPDAHRSAIRIGQLAFDVSVTDDAKPLFTMTGGDIAHMLTSIWPSVTVVSWPPRLSFDDAAWESFVEPDGPPALD